MGKCLKLLVGGSKLFCDLLWVWPSVCDVGLGVGRKERIFLCGEKGRSFSLEVSEEIEFFCVCVVAEAETFLLLNLVSCGVH